MVKSEIISKLSEKIHPKIKRAELKKILNIVLGTIIKEIKYKKSTEIRQFGRFSQKRIKERTNARNPKTGKKIHVEEKISIGFKMSKELKENINKEEL